MFSRDQHASVRVIPVLLDDFARTGLTPRHSDIRCVVVDRAPLDMKDVGSDRAKFEKALRRLLWALRE